MADWFDQNAQQASQDWFDQNIPQASTQEIVPAPSIGQIAQHAGQAAVETVKEFVPKSLGELLGFATGALFPPAGGVEDIGRGYGMLKDVLFGKPINQATAEAFPETQILPEAEKTAPYSEERFKAGFGTLAQMGMAALVGRGLTPKQAGLPDTAEIPIPEVAEIVKPPVQDRQLRVMPERRFTMNEPEPTEAQVETVNRELAPVTEPPEATAKPFPSISRSAEDQRRIEQQQARPQVREAISLDELRLMRERNELQLQNDIAKRATGGSHPAVDERLGQIDEELTNIANKELQTKGGGEIPSATQEGVIQEGGQPEYTGNGEGGPPTEAGSSGSVESVAEVKRTQEVATKAEPQPPAATAPPEKVQPGEFQKPGYTAISTPESAAKAEPIGVAERYREEQQPGSVIPGVGRTSAEARDWGHDFINKGGNPYDLVNQKGPKRELWQDVGGVRAEYERLANEKRGAEEALDADPNNTKLQENLAKADEAQRKWSKDMQPVLTRAGDALRAATRSYPREINSFSDFTDIVYDHFGGEVELNPVKRSEIQKAVKEIKKVNQGSNGARQQVTDAAVKKAGGRTFSFDELKADLDGTVKQLLKDCVL